MRTDRLSALFPETVSFNFREADMLYYSLLFLIIALVAGVLGFTTVAGTAYVAAKILFFVFLILFVVSLLVGRGAPRAAL